MAPSEPHSSPAEDRKDLELLAGAATRLLELGSEADIYRFVADRLREVIGDDAIISVSENDPRHSIFRLRALVGLGPWAERMREVIGRSPADLTGDYPGAVKQAMATSRLVAVEGGVSTLAAEALPRALSEAAARLFGLGEVYVCGFVKDGSLFGGVSIVTRHQGMTLRRSTVEGLIHLAAAALERRRAEEAVREGEARLKMVTSVLYDYVFQAELDDAGTLALSWVSDRFHDVTGSTPERFHNFGAMLETVHPDDRAIVEDTLGHLVSRGEALAVECRTFVHPGSLERMRWVRIACQPMKDSAGRVRSVVGGVQDITARKESEEESARLQLRLFSAQKMEAIGTLAGGIAHDFNNLLSGIMGDVSVLETELAGRPDLLEIVGEVQALARRGADLTNQLLGFARGGKYDLRAVDLNGVLEETAALYGRTRKELLIRRVLDRGMAAVMGDRTQLEQVVLNLLLNAGQAMPSGGELTLESAQVEVPQAMAEAHRVAPGTFARVTLTDTGVGMDEQTRSRVFEPFFSTREPGRGTGLGLASVYGIVKNHHGFVTVESAVGKGSTFAFYLPVTDASAPGAVPAPPAASAVEGRGRLILVVDDEEQILRMAGRMLKVLGFSVLSARGGKEAVELLSANPGRVALVILDMIMPAMGGGETFEALRRIDPAVKVLLCSGYSIEGQAADIMARGCDGFIHKPYDLESLSRKLGQMLDPV